MRRAVACRKPDRRRGLGSLGRFQKQALCRAPDARGGDLRSETGDTLEAGFVVLASGATAAVALEVDTAVRLEVEGLGATGFSVTA